MDQKPDSLVRDLAIVFLSVILAILLIKTGALTGIVGSTMGLKFIGSFMAGIFFVSIFTAAPATAVFVEIAKVDSLFWMAFFGGLGAMIGDLIIFYFIKESLSKSFLYLIKKLKTERLYLLAQSKAFRWILPLIGAIVLASPLPDELGVAILGISKIKTSLFAPLAFILNFFGILAIGLITKKIAG